MDFLATLGGNIEIGFATALTLSNLWYCFLGVLIGMLVGVMPGIGSLAAMAILFPVTFHLDLTGGIIMLAGIYYGSSYGGSTASILLNLPGTPSSAIVVLDGYPMAQQGRAGVALLMTTAASFIGGSIGILLMMFFSPGIVSIARQFGSEEYFALMILGIVAASTISLGAPIKSLAMVMTGVLLGCVGTDIYTGAVRFGFGFDRLTEGLTMVAIAMGIFGIAEVVSTLRHDKKQAGGKVTFRSMIPTRDDVRRSWAPILRGTGVGSFFGALPGTGGLIAPFLAYSIEKRVAREPERFGHGAIEGVVSPEASNNAADQTNFIPTMTLGIPGGAPMAIILGAFLIHGVIPGPTLMVRQPELFWGIVMSFWIGNVILLFLNIPLIGLWIRLLTIPYHMLYPAILVLVAVGVYCVNNSIFDVALVIVFGVVGYAMRLLAFPAAPMLMGFIIGPLIEEHFRRAMIISRGNFMTFIDQPISAGLLAVSLALLVWTLVSGLRNFRRNRLAAAGRAIGG